MSMHGGAHLKPLGHEVQGSYYVGGKRKKPHNPDEVGAVKDHFSEGRQQENLRDSAKHNKSSEAETDLPSFADEVDDQGLYKKAPYASQALSAHLTARALHSLSQEASAHTTVDRKLGMTRSVPQTAEPSLDDLLTLMRTK
jgi:hypothetical protein